MMVCGRLCLVSVSSFSILLNEVELFVLLV